MDQPRRLYGLFSDLLADSAQSETSKASTHDLLSGVISTLPSSDLFRLLEYIRDWNARARDADVAQAVLHIVLKTHTTAQILAAAPVSAAADTPTATASSSTVRPGKIEARSSIADILDALLPYTERHYARMDRLQQESAFLDFILAQMDDYGMDVDGVDQEIPSLSNGIDVDVPLAGR